MFRYFMVMAAAFTATAFLVQLALRILTAVGCSREEALEGLLWALMIIMAVYLGLDAWARIGG